MNTGSRQVFVDRDYGNFATDLQRRRRLDESVADAALRIGEENRDKIFRDA